MNCKFEDRSDVNGIFAFFSFSGEVCLYGS